MIRSDAIINSIENYKKRRPNWKEEFHAVFVNTIGGENGMCMVMTPLRQPANDLRIVRYLGAMVEKDIDWLWKSLTAFVQENKDGTEAQSVRKIQGDRFEIFLDAPGKGSKAFDTIFGAELNHVLGTVLGGEDPKDILLAYARERAQMDKRVGEGYEYQNFSMILSKKGARAQAPHIDLVRPNYQFALYLTGECRSTLFVPDGTIPQVRTVEELQNLWETMQGWMTKKGYANVPPNIIEVFRRSAGVCQLLESFGDTLNPENVLKSNMRSEMVVHKGTVSCLPGTVVHAGPASHGPRAVLFFSGCPVNEDESQIYQADSQYNGVTLLGHLISIAWKKNNIEKADRVFLLNMWAKYIQESSQGDSVGLLGEGNLQVCAEALRKKNYGKFRSLTKFVEAQAECEEMVFAEDPFSMEDD